MAVTDLTGTKWQFKDTILPPNKDGSYLLELTVTSDNYSITLPYTYSGYNYTHVTLEDASNNNVPYCKFGTYGGGSASGYFISYWVEGQKSGKITKTGWAYHTYNYSPSVPLDGNTPIISAPVVVFTGGEDATNADFITWLEANAEQIIEPTSTPTTITYNGATLAELEAGQTATFPQGVKAKTDVSIAFGSKGSITYNGKTTEIEAGKTANLLCGGKKFGTDVVVSVESASNAPEIVSWADGTDEQIAAMVAALDAGTISIEDTGWAVGDERKVTLAAMPATGVGESHVEQTVTMVLMDSQHYTLTEATAGGDTKDHFVVGLKNSLSELGKMNSTSTNSGSWSGCARRAWCNSVFRDAIPETLRGCFKQFKVPTATTYNGSSVTETDDYFALFAEKEIFGTRTRSNEAEANALSQIKWYETADNRKKKALEGRNYMWWERSPRSTDTIDFCYVSDSGNAWSDGAGAFEGISPFGCI